MSFHSVFGCYRPVDTVAYFPGMSEKRGLSFGTRQMIFKELLKERVKRNIRVKSDKQQMPIAINRPADSIPKPCVFLYIVSISKTKQSSFFTRLENLLQP